MIEAKRKIAFVHTSPPAIPPLMQYYAQAAPSLEITNLLEDGLLRLLAQGRHEVVLGRLRSMIAVARETYGAELAMITCSSVPLPMATQLSDELKTPVIKIDGPMARMAVEKGRRIGIVVTFRPTVEPTTRLIREVASSMNREVELEVEIVEGAYDALLSGNPELHDRLVVEGIQALARRDVNSIVLAQVSMARVQQAARDRVPVPLLSSLDTSLSAIRALL